MRESELKIHRDVPDRTRVFRIGEISVAFLESTPEVPLDVGLLRISVLF
ncbi:MAG: hypothetical protein RL173_1608 [Fibrobacterota bacterium]|jgi:hypothetical protein